MRAKRTVILCLCLSIYLIASLPSPATAQIPDTYTNLKVLPEDITKPELVGEMKAMATGLGVRCEHCHAGDPSKGLAGLDFASDEKVAKKKARVMLEMVKAINGQYLNRIDSSTMASTQVTCITCHHRQEKPRSLGAELAAAVDSGGVKAAIALYNERREAFYGMAVYDFGEQTIVELASQLAQAQEMDAAIGLMQINVEHFPQSSTTYQTLAMLNMQSGKNEDAIAAIKKAIELDPDNPRLQGMLKRLEGN